MTKKLDRNKTRRKPNAKSLENLKKGKGRPPGTPNKVTTEAKAAANALVDDPIYRQKLLERMREGTAGAVEVLMWHYAKGKPKERIELGADEKLSDLLRQAAKLPPLPPPPEYVADQDPEDSQNP